MTCSHLSQCPIKLYSLTFCFTEEHKVTSANSSTGFKGALNIPEFTIVTSPHLSSYTYRWLTLADVSMNGTRILRQYGTISSRDTCLLLSISWENKAHIKMDTHSSTLLVYHQWLIGDGMSESSGCLKHTDMDNKWLLGPNAVLS